MDSKATLKQALMDVRKMRRDIRLRKETDPEKVADILERILKESIVLSASEDTIMSKAAIGELKQVRRDMIAGQVNAGEKTSLFVGSFSAVLDEIDKAAKETQEFAKQQGYDTEAFSRKMTDAIPSQDTVISAIMTANPILGYSMKMSRDLISGFKNSSKQRKEREKQEAQIRKQHLEKQKELLENQLKTSNIEKENAIEEGKKQDSPKKRRRGIYANVLEDIRNDIDELTKVMTGKDPKLERETNTSVEKIEESSKDTQSSIEKMEKIDKEKIRLEKENAKIEGLKKQEAAYESFDKTNKTPSLNFKNEEPKEGFFGKLFSGEGIKGLLSPFTKLFSILTIGAMILKPLIKGGVVIEAIKGIYDFIEGIFDANNILGKKDIDWKDRVEVGVGNVLSGIIEQVNGLLKSLTGIDIIDKRSRDQMTKVYYDFFHDFTKNLVWLTHDLSSRVMDEFNKWADESEKWLSGLIEEAFDPLKKLMENISNYISNKIDEFVPDWAKDWFTNSSDNNMDNTNKQPLSVMGLTLDNVNPPQIRNHAALNNMNEYDTQTSPTNSGSPERGVLFAPSQNQTNVNNHQYMGNGSSENREPTHRKFSQWNNKSFGFN